MPGQVLRQPRPFQFPFPILGRDVRVRDLTVQCVRVLRGKKQEKHTPFAGNLGRLANKGLGCIIACLGLPNLSQGSVCLLFSYDQERQQLSALLDGGIGCD
jgi:hypothetical protein